MNQEKLVIANSSSVKNYLSETAFANIYSIHLGYCNISFLSTEAAARPV